MSKVITSKPVAHFLVGGIASFFFWMLLDAILRSWNEGRATDAVLVMLIMLLALLVVVGVLGVFRREERLDSYLFKSLAASIAGVVAGLLIATSQ